MTSDLDIIKPDSGFGESILREFIEVGEIWEVETHLPISTIELSLRNEKCEHCKHWITDGRTMTKLIGS